MTNSSSLPSSFRTWLRAGGYSPSTIRNYLVDVNKYLATVSEPQIFSSPSLKVYITAITGQNNYRRQLASLAKFCQFALDQKIISQNPLAQTDSTYDIKSLLSHFEQHLLSQNMSPVTIKNYINDLKQYFEFINSNQTS